MNTSSTRISRLRKEGLLTISDAVRKVQGDAPSYRTGLRWCIHGIRGGIKLESVKCGHRRMTSVEAVERFFDALEPQPDTAGHPGVVAARQVAADEVLGSFGLGREATP